MTKDKHECEDAETIREKYKELVEKYKLPNFEEVNKDFDIIKVDCDSETILRDIRKVVVSKFSSVLQFVELLLNPTNGSMFHMYLVKGVRESEKKTLNKLFKQLGNLEIDSYLRDVTYEEKAEAEFIKDKFKIWKKMQPEITEIINSLKENWEKESSKKEKSYFG